MDVRGLDAKLCVDSPLIQTYGRARGKHAACGRQSSTAIRRRMGSLGMHLMQRRTSKF